MRRVPLPRLPLFSELSALVAQLFPALNNAYSIKYFDIEGDSITIASDADIVEAFAAASKPIKFFVIEKPAPAPAPAPAPSVPSVYSPSPATSTPPPVVEAASKCPFGGRRAWRASLAKDGAADCAAQRPWKREGGCHKDVHHGIQCDECKAFPIVGVRYKCTGCDNFDLCEVCEQKKAHDPTHAFLKIVTPSTPRFFPRFHGGRKQFCVQGTPAAEPASPLEAPAVTTPECPWAGKFKRTKFLARFVSDVSVPAGTVMEPGQNFVKIWKIKNTGALAWPESTLLSFNPRQGGDLLGAPSEVPVGPLAEDGVVEIQVPCVAPTQPGRYLSSWKLVDGGNEGCRFGQRLWIDIVVAAPSEKTTVQEVIPPATLPPPLVPTIALSPVPVEPILHPAVLPATPDEAKMLTTLTEMGFVHPDLLAVLRRHKGRLGAAVRELVGAKGW